MERKRDGEKERWRERERERERERYIYIYIYIHTYIYIYSHFGSSPLPPPLWGFWVAAPRGAGWLPGHLRGGRSSQRGGLGQHTDAISDQVRKARRPPYGSKNYIDQGKVWRLWYFHEVPAQIRSWRQASAVGDCDPDCFD